MRDKLEEYKNKINTKRENNNAVYLQIASSIESIQKQAGTRYVHLVQDESGNLLLTHAQDEKIAEIALLRNGAMIPNPHFYENLTADGETGEKLGLIKGVFDLPAMYDDEIYIVSYLAPAVGEIYDNTLHVKRKGKIEI